MLVFPSSTGSSDHYVSLKPDGIRARLRPAARGDAPALLEMHGRLSMDSLYFRYLAPYRPGMRQMEAVCQRPEARGSVFVAEVDGPRSKIIGTAEFARVNDFDPEAEVGILVEDQFQGLGVGRALLRRLTAKAGQVGLERFKAIVHVENRKAFRLFQGAGRVERILTPGHTETLLIELPDTGATVQGRGNEDRLTGFLSDWPTLEGCSGSLQD